MMRGRAAVMKAVATKAHAAEEDCHILSRHTHLAQRVNEPERRKMSENYQQNLVRE